MQFFFGRLPLHEELIRIYFKFSFQRLWKLLSDLTAMVTWLQVHYLIFYLFIKWCTWSKSCIHPWLRFFMLIILLFVSRVLAENRVPSFRNSALFFLIEVVKSLSLYIFPLPPPSWMSSAAPKGRSYTYIQDVHHREDKTDLYMMRYTCCWQCMKL